MRNAKKRRYLMWKLATLSVDQRDDNVRRHILMASNGVIRPKGYNAKLTDINTDIEYRRETIQEVTDALSALGSRNRENGEG